MSHGSSGACWSCGRELADGEYGRMESCSGCGADTKCCRNCAHYSPAFDDQCDEPAADEVKDKERANFCEFFRACRPGAAGAKPAGPDSAKSAFDALFKKKPGA